MLFFSNVFSLMDWSAEGVEPCTRMYIRHIELASFNANQLQGPELSIGIRFNQFNNQDYGFGTGWELSFSRMETSLDLTGNPVKDLVLSDGARYRVSAETADAVTLMYKKINTFKISKNTEGYRIDYKNGMYEILDALSGRVKKIVNTNGRYVTIEWFDNKMFSVREEIGLLMLSTVFVSEAGGSRVQVSNKRDELIFYLDEIVGVNVLTSVSSKARDDMTRNGMICAINYAPHNDKCFYITYWASWLGYYFSEFVSYDNLSSPAGLSVLVPAVSAVTSNSFPLRKTKYSCADTGAAESQSPNYLGYPQVTKWVDGQDNLDLLMNDFSFSCFEKMENGGVEVSNKKSVYNKFYLQVEQDESCLSEDRRMIVKYYYDAPYSVKIDTQKNTFMLFLKKSLIQQTRGNDNVKWVTVQDDDVFEYDSDGNITRHTNREGMTEWYEYYDAGGEPGCPPSPAGFINYPKLKILSSGVSPEDVPRKRWTYTYATAGTANLVLMSSESFFMDLKPADVVDGPTLPALKRDDYSYLENGRLRELRNTLPGPLVDGVPTNLVSLKKIGYTDQVDTVTITETFIGYQNRTVKSSETRQYRTDDVISRTDRNGVKTSYTYDYLGRVTGTIHAEGTDYAVKEIIAFDDMSSQKTVSSNIETLRRRTTFDREGHVVREEIILPGQAGAHDIICVTAGFEYNASGQLIRKTEYDYEADGKLFSTQETFFSWNQFDELLMQKNWDKSQEKYQYDAYNYSHFRKNIVINREPGNSQEQLFYDKNNRLRKRERRSPSSKLGPDLEETFDYDEFGRLKMHAETYRETLSYEYDAFDRMVVKTGDASGKVTTRYAPHSIEELIVETQVDDVVISRFSYDDLGRTTLSVSEGCAIYYSYEGSKCYTRPSKVLTGYDEQTGQANGRCFEYAYIPELDQIASCKVSSASGDKTFSISEFDFYQPSGLMYKSRFRNMTTVNQFVFERVFDYDGFSNLRYEQGGWEYYDIAYHRTRYERTIKGLPLRIELRLWQGNDFLIRKNLSYQSDGRVKNIVFFIGEQCISKSDVVWNSETGNLDRVESSGKAAASDKMLAWCTIYEYGEYNRIKSLHYKDDKGLCFVCEGEYHANGNVSRLFYDFWGEGATKWNELFAYGKRGEVTRWRQNGGMVYMNEYGDRVVEQTFKYDHMQRITRKNSATGKLAIHEDYIYADSGRLEKIKKVYTVNGSLELPWGEVSFVTDAEGNFTEKKYQRGNDCVLTSYWYRLNSNFSDFSNTVTLNGLPGQEVKSSYSYDAHERLIYVYSSSKVSPEESEHAQIYVDGEIMVEQNNTTQNERVEHEWRLFHKVEGRTVFITYFTPGDFYRNTREMRFCRTQPVACGIMGNQVAEGVVEVGDVKNKPLRHKYYNHYKYALSGQNAYGLEFSLKMIPRMVYHEEKKA